jgi:hypothetical protein
VAVRFVQPTLVFPRTGAKTVLVEVTARRADSSGSVTVKTPSGWHISPASQSFKLGAAGEQAVLSFSLEPAANAQSGNLKASAETGGTVVQVSIHKISYPHIPIQTLFPAAAARLVRVGAETLARRVGYVMGTGDDVPEALRQLGCEVVLLTENDLARGDLSQFDAIVTGIRAFTERPDLAANELRLIDYVAKGGTLIVQYNRIERDTAHVLKHMGPYPFQIGHDRVTVEEAPVSFRSTDPLLSQPNQITAEDFAGWTQERGLYFASQWDPHYSTPFELHDPGEAPLYGGTLVTKYGSGVYIFTAFSWFRELPAGVPGAYRIFANMLSASKTMNAASSQAKAAGR